MELLLAEEEQQAAKKASGKKNAAAKKKKQASRLPNSGGASSQETASTTLDPPCLQDSSAAAADSASSARGSAPAPDLQQRLGAAASANMAIARASGLIPPTPTGSPPEIVRANERDELFVRSAVEEIYMAAEAAAESPASSSPAGHPADQLTGLVTTTAAAYAPASLADGTKKRASLLQTEGGPAVIARLSPLESDLSVCAFYPDDFVMSCKSEGEAAAMLQQPGAITRQDEKDGEGSVAADPTAALLNFQALLHHSLRCPLSGVRFLQVHASPTSSLLFPTAPCPPPSSLPSPLPLPPPITYVSAGMS